MHNATLSSHSYDFRKDFSNICKRGLDRYLDISADLLGDEFDADREAAYAKEYVRGQWRTLKFEQKIADLSEGVEPSPPMGSPPGTPPYIHPPWNAERAADIAAEFEADVIDAERRGAAETNPVDIYRAVHLGTEMARKQNAGGDLPFTIDTGPEAVAYATDRLKSKIERNAVHNPIEEMYSGFLSYRFLKGMPGGEKVVYIDHYKRRQAKAPEAAPGQPIGEQAMEPKPDVKPAECMFQRIGLLNSQPREYLVKGFIPRNEVCNPFGRPDSFKGVFAAQLAVHIAGGIDFLGMPLRQGPSAYFAAERGEQVKRRIKGHIQRLGLPYDLPCYFGGKPIDLLSKPDLDFLIANIHAIEHDAGRPLVFLLIDTQSRTMGGDENSTADGAAYAKAVGAIRQATEATLWIISHTGHSEDAQGRPRGSSALLGAYDTFYRHKKIDEQRGEIKITVDRDGLGGKELPFTVELYDTGTVNEDGEPALVPYLEAAAPTARFTFKKGGEPTGVKNPTKGESEALRALDKAIRKHGVVTPKGEGIPAGEVTVNEQEWREAFYELFRGREQGTLRQGFSRSTKGLIVKKLVNEYGSRRWSTDK